MSNDFSTIAPKENALSETNLSLVKRRTAAFSTGVGVMNPVYVARASNAEVWDIEGNRYIDFAAGIAVVNTGHCHPKVTAAVHAQVDAFTHTCHHVLPYGIYVDLAERLNGLVSGEFAKKTAFFTTGAEAVENCIKIARAATGRAGVISFGGGYHGRTFMTMSLTGKIKPYKAGFGPMMAGVYQVPFPSDLYGVTVDESVAAIERLFRESIQPEQVAAIIIEPVQGEGGFFPAPPALLQQLRKICDLHGILLIADEVQTGFGRTGAYFAMEHSGVAPDLTAMAKGIAGGFPLSAVTGRTTVMDAVSPGGIGGTYGGNPVSIAAALAVLDVIEEEQLCRRANTLGAKLMSALSEISNACPELVEVRGTGLMIAAEFRKADGVTPNSALVTEIRNQARARGLILLHCGMYDNVIRFLPPLTTPHEVFEEGLEILAASVTAAREVINA